MNLQIDISGQIQQLNYDSGLGFKRNDGFTRSVYLGSDVKKEIIKKYKGQITNLIEKIHCILIYYCIKDFLEGIDEIIICRDVDFRRVKRLLPLLFKENNNLCNTNIKQRDSDGEKSTAHNIAIKTFRKKRYANLIINKEMIEDVILKFKE